MTLTDNYNDYIYKKDGIRFQFYSAELDIWLYWLCFGLVKMKTIDKYPVISEDGVYSCLGKIEPLNKGFVNAKCFLLQSICFIGWHVG